MRTLGFIILIIGIILGIYALSMDTSVQVNYNGNSFGLPERVNNIGLMNTKQNLIIVACVLSIIGTLILIFKKLDNTDDYPVSEVKGPEYKGKYKESQSGNVEISKEVKGEESIIESPLETLRKLKDTGIRSILETFVCFPLFRLIKSLMI